MTSSPALPIITLQPERQRRVRAGHPWVYSNEIAMTASAKALAAGSLVQLNASDGESLGTALFNPHTLVAARLVSRKLITTLDRAFFAERVTRAIALRDRLFDAPYYRLAHAEADGLPGTIIDRYGDVVVIQLNTAGVSRFQDLLCDAIGAALSPRAIVLRNDTPARGTEGLDSEIEVARGKLEHAVELVENGVRFQVDVLGGQKTGWFYDQRDNRAAIAKLSKGARVLDVFTYAGGFGIQSAVAGAESVTLVDSSGPALANAMISAGLNGVAAKVKTQEGDAFQILDQYDRNGERFGVVVVDPPAFVKSKKDLGPGLQAYRKMVRSAARLVAPGGFMLAASCSHNVDETAFAEAVRGGLARAQRNGRILRTAGAAADHPVHPFLPESAYLKATILQLD